MCSELDAPLIGAEYEHAVTDCYGLVRRWYWQERGVLLPDFPRSPEWWDHGGDLFTENFRAAGFYVPVSDPVVGDVFLMRIASRVPNHAAVYLGGDTVLHHLPKQLSRREGLSRYFPRVTHILRYKGTT
jgi:cell wall-associated NlpC family hydrolase